MSDKTKPLPSGWRWVTLGGKNGCSEIVNGSTPSTDEPSYWNGDIPWATPSDMGKLRTIYIQDTEKKITQAGFKSCSTQLLPIGTVLMTSRAPVGNIAIASRPMCTNQGFKSFVPKEGVNSLYLYFALRAIVPSIQKKSHGNTFTEITKGLVAKFRIPLPPTEDEQNAIASSLEKRLNCIELLRAATARQSNAIATLPNALIRAAFDFTQPKQE